MATSFELIYKKFLGMIDDYELGLVSEEELNEILFGYLDEARSLYFPQCKKDLDKINENQGVGEFLEDLNSQEQFILALCMKRAWISPKVLNADLMSQEIGDRDYKAIQGTSYLRELSKVKKEISEEINDYTKDYSWKDFSTEDW